MPPLTETKLDKLVTAVSQTTKYQYVSPELIRRVGTDELGKRRSYKEALKATKNKLHQVGGAYQDSKIDYANVLARLEESQRGLVLSDVEADAEAQRAGLVEVMRLHTSTRERLWILDDFYTEVLAGLPPITSVMDIACGLNPLARRWMPLADNATYLAYDIYADMMTFLGDYFALANIPGRAEVRDVVDSPPTEPVDLALLLKTLPVLAQIDKTAVPRLLDSLQAKYLLISFPAKSLGGRSKGMVQNYEIQFEGWIAGRGWEVKRFEFENELAFLVETNL
jgi:16S rRNA (guanine(1405)-N(7))-methyltransferase